MCGEHRSIVGIGVACQGSSPHVRGALNHSQDCKNRHGIIPACAGSTRCETLCMARHRDHPRMCGEHMRSRSRSSSSKGSSPHVRGAQRCGHTDISCTGIIPACAGSTVTQNIEPGIAWDHPRMCGEHGHGQPYEGRDVGSSPHVRGARVPDR